MSTADDFAMHLSATDFNDIRVILSAMSDQELEAHDRLKSQIEAMLEATPPTAANAEALAERIADVACQAWRDAS